MGKCAFIGAVLGFSLSDQDEFDRDELDDFYSAAIAIEKERRSSVVNLLASMFGRKR